MTEEDKAYYYKGIPIDLDEGLDTPFIYMINSNDIKWSFIERPMYIGTVHGDEYRENLSQHYKKQELDTAMVSASDEIADTIMTTNPLFTIKKD